MIEAMKLLVSELEYVLDCIDNQEMPFDDDEFHEALRLGRQAIAEAAIAEQVPQERKCENCGEFGECCQAEKQAQPAQDEPNKCRKAQTISGDYVCDCRIGECPRNKEGRIVSECALPTDDGLVDQQSPSPRGVGKTIIQQSAEKQEPVAVYGYCPECGEKGVARERRPNGNDCCVNGHIYPSRTALPAPQRQWVGLTQTEVVDLLCEYNKLTGNVGWQHLVYMTEAKLKEKNT